MFTLNSNYKNVILKSLSALGIFLFFLFGLLYYLENYTITYRPLGTKAKMLLSQKEYKFIVGGDSRNLSNVNPLMFGNSAVNISYKGGASTSFSKAVQLYQKDLKNKILIYNIGIINLNDTRFPGSFSSLSDDIISLPYSTMIKAWKFNTVKNYLSLIRCYFSSCSFYHDSNEYIVNRELGYAPYKGSMPDENLNKTTNSFYKNYESLYRNFTVNGHLLQNLMTQFYKLSQAGANVFITFPPVTKTLLATLYRYGDPSKMDNLFLRLNTFAAKLPNVWFLNYMEYDKTIPTLNNSFFADLNHLNREGGTIYTRKLKEDINRLMENRNADRK